MAVGRPIGRPDMTPKDSNAFQYYVESVAVANNPVGESTSSLRPMLHAPSCFPLPLPPVLD